MKIRLETVALVTAVWGCLLPAALGARILAVFPMEGRSHWMVHRELLVELARRGHSLTVVTPFHQQGDPWEIVKPSVPLAGSQKVDFLEYGSLPVFTQFLILFHVGTDFCQRLMDDPALRELIVSRDRQFDLLIMETFFHECFLALSHQYQVPTVLSCAFGGGSSWTNHAVGNPYPLSYLPEGGVAFTTRMSLLQKTYNVLLSLALNLYRELVFFPALDAMVRERFQDPTVPPLRELERNTSLLLLNNHFSFDYARPLAPNAVQVAGMHIRPPEALPKELQEFMDAASEGVIYFSMGSNFRSVDMLPQMRAVFLRTFTRLRQKVLWKFEDDALPGQPANLRISKWFPQSDLLGTQRMRASTPGCSTTGRRSHWRQQCAPWSTFCATAGRATCALRHWTSPGTSTCCSTSPHSSCSVCWPPSLSPRSVSGSSSGNSSVKPVLQHRQKGRLPRKTEHLVSSVTNDTVTPRRVLRD